MNTCTVRFAGLPGIAIGTPGTAQCSREEGHDGDHEVKIRWSGKTWSAVVPVDA